MITAVTAQCIVRYFYVTDRCLLTYILLIDSLILLIRLQLADAAETIMDSGPIYDTSISGGRLGLFVFNQKAAVWSNLVARCVERVNMALRLDGADDYVLLPDIHALQLQRRYG